MRDEAIIDALQSLGIDRASYKVIALLPLVEMAWADGKVQEEERRLILRIASNHGRLGGEGLRVLENWLAVRAEPRDQEARKHHRRRRSCSGGKGSVTR
jgi:uncharacterized tellurite resistance protein B-like protein